MKKRARIVSGLAALAALFLAPVAEASITCSSAPAREAPALALTLAAPEPSEFSLFDGTELARALASHPALDLISIMTDETPTAARTRFVSSTELSADELPNNAPELLPITSVREQRFNLQLPPDVFGLEPLRGPPGDEASYPKTRYRVFGLLGTPILGELRGVSLELHWRSASFSCGLASGTVGWLSEDPLGDKDSPNLYGFVGARPHERTDPLGLAAACPIGLTLVQGPIPQRPHCEDAAGTYQPVIDHEAEVGAMLAKPNPCVPGPCWRLPLDAAEEGHLAGWQASVAADERLVGGLLAAEGAAGSTVAAAPVQAPRRVIGRRMPIQPRSGGESEAARRGRSHHAERAEARRAAGGWSTVNEPIRYDDGTPVRVPGRVDLETGEPVQRKGMRRAVPDAVNYELRLIVDDKPISRDIVKDRQQMIRYIQAYAEARGSLPKRIAIERYDPETNEIVQTDLHDPSAFLPKKP